jgi:hypothetical protein
MTLIKLVCPTGQDREIPSLDLVVAHGSTVSVDAAVAGRPPTGEPGDEGYEPGVGLLAQHHVWAPGKAARAVKAAKKAPPKPAAAAKAMPPASDDETGEQA